MTANLPRRAIELVASPYPARFDDSTFQYSFALFGLMTITVVGSMLFCWMAKEAWQGRRDAYPYEPLFAIRAVFLLASFNAVLRAAPEAAAAITWRENPGISAKILVFKSWADGFSVGPALTWMGLVYVFYPMICLGLVRIAHEERGPSIPVHKLKQRVTKLMRVTITLFAIAVLIAWGKR